MIGIFDGWFHGPAWAVQDVERLSDAAPNRYGVKQRTVHFRTDRPPMVILESQVDDLLKRPIQLIPAQASVNLIRIWKDDDPVEAYRSTLVAWALCFDGEIRPVTAGGVNDGLGLWETFWLEYPDGHVEAVGSDVHPFAAADVEALKREVAIERDRVKAEHVARIAALAETPDAD